LQRLTPLFILIARGGGGGYRAPSYRAPSYRPPSYHPTAARRPPSYHPTSAPYRPRPSPATHRPSPRPQPPAYEPPSRVATSRPVHQTGYRPPTTARPGIYRPGSTHRPYAPAGTTRRTYHPAGTTPRRYTTARPSYGSYGTNWNNLPPRPGHGPVGPPRYGTHAGGWYSDLFPPLRLIDFSRVPRTSEDQNRQQVQLSLSRVLLASSPTLLLPWVLLHTLVLPLRCSRYWQYRVRVLLRLQFRKTDDSHLLPLLVLRWVQTPVRPLHGPPLLPQPRVSTAEPGDPAQQYSWVCWRQYHNLSSKHHVSLHF
jgi:hypothetical protein